MDIIILLVFISLILVGAALAFFRSRLKDGDLDHGERLSLLPLLEDDGRNGSGDQRTAANRAVDNAGDAAARRPRAAKEEGTAYGSR